MHSSYVFSTGGSNKDWDRSSAAFLLHVSVDVILHSPVSSPKKFENPPQTSHVYSFRTTGFE